MEIIVGGAKQDKAPVGHAATAPHHHKVNTYRGHGCQVHLAVAVTASTRQLDKQCDSLAIPPKKEEK